MRRLPLTALVGFTSTVNDYRAFLSQLSWNFTSTTVRFTLNSSTRIIEFRGFSSRFSTNFHEIVHILFSIHVATTLGISRSFDKYFKNLTIWHVIKFWDEANGIIEGNIFIYLPHIKWSNFLNTCQNFAKYLGWSRHKWKRERIGEIHSPRLMWIRL